LLACYLFLDHARFWCGTFLYQQNCTVELLIRIPPVLYALVGGAIMVKFRLVWGNWTGIL